MKSTRREPYAFYCDGICHPAITRPRKHQPKRKKSDPLARLLPVWSNSYGTGIDATGIAQKTTWSRFDYSFIYCRTYDWYIEHLNVRATNISALVRLQSPFVSQNTASCVLARELSCHALRANSDWLEEKLDDVPIEYRYGTNVAGLTVEGQIGIGVQHLSQPTIKFSHLKSTSLTS